MKTHTCVGEQVKSGLCPGDNDNKCCPTSNALEKTATPSPPPSPPPSPSPSPSPQPASADDACLYGQKGACINVKTHTCVGEQVKSGFCPGDNDNKCCPTSTARETEATSHSTPARPAVPCKRGQPGQCIDTNAQTCGVATLSGYCDGPSNVRCCAGDAEARDPVKQGTKVTITLFCDGGSPPTFLQPAGSTYTNGAPELMATKTNGFQGGKGDVSFALSIEGLGPLPTDSSDTLRDCTNSEISPQDWGVACLCRTGNCVGEQCFKQSVDGQTFSFWKRGACGDCDCAGSLDDTRRELFEHERMWEEGGCAANPQSVPCADLGPRIKQLQENVMDLTLNVKVDELSDMEFQCQQMGCEANQTRDGCAFCTDVTRAIKSDIDGLRAAGAGKGVTASTISAADDAGSSQTGLTVGIVVALALFGFAALAVGVVHHRSREQAHGTGVRVAVNHTSGQGAACATGAETETTYAVPMESTGMPGSNDAVGTEYVLVTTERSSKDRHNNRVGASGISTSSSPYNLSSSGAASAGSSVYGGSTHDDDDYGGGGVYGGGNTYGGDVYGDGGGAHGGGKYGDANYGGGGVYGGGDTYGDGGGAHGGGNHGNGTYSSSRNRGDSLVLSNYSLFATSAV